MGEAKTAVDVSDMLCAQALVVVAKALAPLPNGAGVTVRYTTDDVKRDLMAWATERAYTTREVDGTTLRIEKP